MKMRLILPKPFEKSFEMDVRVDAQGMFACVLPADIAAIFKEHGIKLGYNRANRFGFFKSDRLESLKDDVKAKIAELCSVEEIDRRDVIQYGIETICSYAIGDDGDFLPRPKGGQWSGGTVHISANERKPYGLRMVVQPRTRVTYRYKATGKERVDYEEIERGKSEDADWLADLTGMSGERYWITETVKIQEVPLNPETAAFFVKLFKSLFSLNEKIKPFLHPEGIAALASGNEVKLLG